MNKKRALKNLTTLKMLENTDEKLAVKIVSSPNIDREELSEIIESSIAGNFSCKETGQILQLNDNTIMSAMTNILALERIKNKDFQIC